MVSRGELFGKTFLKNYFNWKLNYQSSKLKQSITGINFIGPIGLAAGFDYEAKLTQILYSLGFGFQSIGTITNLPYEGNSYPQLGRLPKSRSLMDNKGFKIQEKEISQKLSQLDFKVPVGISIGMTNSKDIKTIFDAVNDIKNAFQIFGKTKIKNSYYELNISCPNLINTGVDFYKSENFNQLLQSINRLKLKKRCLLRCRFHY
jgi:dihydroorotate dehydrogenase